MSYSFVEVLKQYIQVNENPVGSNGALPFRLPNHIIKEEEFESECIDLTINHLTTNSFPDVLASSITHSVVESIQTQDLSDAMKNDEAGLRSYETIKIAQIIFSLVHSLCNDWILNFPSYILSYANPVKHSQYGIKNTRRKMEDRHTVFPNLNILLGLKDCPVIQWYAVYDGHGGLDASCYAAKQLHMNFVKEDGFLSNVSESLKKCIRKTDDDFCNKSQNERLRSGTTAVVAVIVEQTLYGAWVGDSQAILVRNGQPVQNRKKYTRVPWHQCRPLTLKNCRGCGSIQEMNIMNPHKPDRADEKQRIEDLGGCVVWFGAWRVNGTLSVSRAIGDAEHKPFISGDADTFRVPLDGSEDFLCLACDGFWDVFNGDDLVKLVQEYLRENKNREEISEFLCMKAKAEGSSDNITVVVVFLRDDVSMGDELTKQDSTEANRLSDSKSDSPSNENNNNNSNKAVEQSPDESSGGLSIIQGQQLDLEQKLKIPHKLLVNFVRNATQKKADKGAVIVTSSSPHAKLPHSIRNLKLENHHHPMSTLPRADNRGRPLSLATVETVTHLPATKAKWESDKNNNNITELPCINTGKPLPRRSTMLPSCGYVEVRKPLGHRAPNKHALVRTRVPYRTSIVGTSRTPSPPRGYSSSLPDDVMSCDENGRTKYAITNSLAPSLKLRQEKAEKKRQILTLIHKRQRRRSRSLF